MNAELIQVGERVIYRRRGELRFGTIVGIETGSLNGPCYVVRNDASDIRAYVFPQEIVSIR